MQVLIECPNQNYYITARKRPTAPAPRGREAQAQAEAPRAAPEQLLHGRQVPRLLQDHHRLQSRADGRALRRLQHRPVPAHGREGQAHRRYVECLALY